MPSMPNIAPPRVLHALAVFSLALTGCNGVWIGNLFVLALTLMIFVGTLGLGRSRTGPRMPVGGGADRSQSDV